MLFSIAAIALAAYYLRKIVRFLHERHQTPDRPGKIPPPVAQTTNPDGQKSRLRMIA